MIWITLGIILLAIIGLVLFGFSLYKKKLSQDIRQLKQLMERFTIRQQTLQTNIDHTTQRIDQIKGNINRITEEGNRVKQGASQLVTEGRRLQEEIKRTAGIKQF
ncbi:hypothetical protein ASF99_15900 [Exiguobacterium sp. Leaf187]|uniref:Uncharacterized protein n=1 Tax=Exiguobacterium indicum TaxID=296995 RepID=A0A0V8GG25_9BACL|nr:MULTISPECIES: hypothetical protein [Exiguobacterium]AHA29189.1 hypothetical protein U719_04650 [Exiguobacterium sp. MH3]KNH33982.1 hypothetical protein ACS74_11310 [Exiguobacterium acetylicum]KQS20447.1 hypothetical protein ASF99_15900 [Exiguobacterium sp. Leaf187]KSU49213.1 hypothetical protein AS033_07515 [Exiguobacterium enclense]MCQ4090999.1 hypothetical protein [Exiguobacterium sp. LL15]